MKLESPLSNLIDRCMTICVAECCGIDAYNFSPIHIASFLLMHRGATDPIEISQIRDQLKSLKRQYGIAGELALGVTIEEMNQIFLPAEIDSLCEKIDRNLNIALQIIEEVRNFAGA